MATNPMDVRLARLEGSFEQIPARLGAIELRLSQVETRLDHMETRLDQRMSRLEEKVDRQFHWIVGLMFISILAPIALRFVPLP